VSDPGVELVQAAVAAGIPVDPIPGVSAPLTAAIASGFPLVPLTVFGFAPARSKDRSLWLESISSIRNTLTFFETPHRIVRTMEEAGQLLGNRPIVVGRELTKAHQEFIRGTALGLAKKFNEPRGEYTVVVGPSLDIEPKAALEDDAAIVADFCYSTEVVGNSRRAAINAVAKKHQLPSRVVYQIVERSKNLANNQQ
jgi:16S rRNA (cytidine1402-2'-O)-methyltransferase